MKFRIEIGYHRIRLVFLESILIPISNAHHSHALCAHRRSISQKIQPVRADGNLLLCTLLLGNVAVNALLSIVMAELTSGIVGFALATGIITIFGEIVPQVKCTVNAIR